MSPAASRPFSLAWRVALLGLPGAVALGLAAPGGGAEALRIVLQAGVAVLLAAAIGAALAPSIGLQAPWLQAWAEGRPAPRPSPDFVRATLLGGVAGAGLLLSAGALAPPGVDGVPPLGLRLLWQGLAEEILVRWGLMSALLALLLGPRGPGPGGPSLAVPLAITASALAYAGAQGPGVLGLAGPLDGLGLAWLLIANGSMGLIAGGLFWRHGLESAMLAHLLAHALAAGAAHAGAALAGP